MAMSTTDQLEQWDVCREMVFRTAWKPYMYSQTLPHLLGGVQAPALVVWGDDDQHVPKSAGDVYARRYAMRGWKPWPAADTMWIWRSLTSWPNSSSTFVNAN